MLSTILPSTANLKNKQTILCPCKKMLIKPFSATSLQGSIRNFPNEYSQGHLDFDVRTGNNHKVPNHEINHGIIRRNRDGALVGLFTSKPKATFNAALVDDKEYINGTPVPANSPPGTGQYATVFAKSKIVDVPVEKTKKPLFKVDKKAQKYMDKHEEKFKKLYDNVDTVSQEVRLKKDDSRFYHENGQRDDDF